MTTPNEIREFLRRNSLAVEATVATEGAPQAAVIGFVVSDVFEIFFDTVDTTRKCVNLRRRPQIALVIGWDAITVQYEGIADEPSGAELDSLKKLYLARFPDGVERESWPGITYFRVRPTWLRYSDFTVVPPTIVELSAAELATD